MKKITIKCLIGNDQRLSYPSGICYHRESQLFYIADMNHHRLCAYDASKDHIVSSVSAISESISLEKPLAVSTTPDGTLVVADASLNNIYLWNPGDTLLQQVDSDKDPSTASDVSQSALDFPGGVTVDGDGNIYTNDFMNNRIVRINPDGWMETMIGGEYGLKDGDYESARINQPYGLFYQHNKVYFADAENKRIRCLDLANQVVTSVTPSASDTELNRPNAVTLDPSGNIYICDQRRILHISKHTKELSVIIDKTNWKQWASKLNLESRIGHIGAIVAPEEGRFYWLDTIRGTLYETWVS